MEYCKSLRQLSCHIFVCVCLLKPHVQAIPIMPEYFFNVIRRHNGTYMLIFRKPNRTVHLITDIFSGAKLTFIITRAPDNFDYLSKVISDPYESKCLRLKCEKKVKVVQMPKTCVSTVEQSLCDVLRQRF